MIVESVSLVLMLLVVLLQIVANVQKVVMVTTRVQYNVLLVLQVFTLK